MVVFGSRGVFHAAEATGARCIRMALQPMYPTRNKVSLLRAGSNPKSFG